LETIDGGPKATLENPNLLRNWQPCPQTGYGEDGLPSGSGVCTMLHCTRPRRHLLRHCRQFGPAFTGRIVIKTDAPEGSFEGGGQWRRDESMDLPLDDRLRIGVQTIHLRIEPAGGPWLPTIDEMYTLVEPVDRAAYDSLSVGGRPVRDPVRRRHERQLNDRRS
jgi:hypothetical protein